MSSLTGKSKADIVGMHWMSQAADLLGERGKKGAEGGVESLGFRVLTEAYGL